MEMKLQSMGAAHLAHLKKMALIAATSNMI
jgi:hypothetical protein